MGWILKSCQRPELLSRNYTINIICNIIINLIIRHCTDNQIIIMRYTMTAGDNEVQPFLCHLFKFQNFKTGIHTDGIYIHNWRIIPFCPAFCLLTDDRTVKSGTKIFCVFTLDNLRHRYGGIAAMINCHFSHPIDLQSYSIIFTNYIFFRLPACLHFYVIRI